MNSVSLIGRLTKDPDIRYTGEQLCVARFTLAVDAGKDKDGEGKADFPSCVAFGKTAELIEKYVRKGSQIGIKGAIKTGSYKNKDGNTVYTTDVNAERIYLLDSKKKEEVKPAADDVPQGFSQLAEDLPF